MRWRPKKIDVVFVFGIAMMVYGASGIPSEIVSGALIGAGPLLILTGLGLRKEP